MTADEKPSARVCEHSHTESQHDVEDAWYREIERRAAELNSGAAETIPWGTVRARPARAETCRNSNLRRL